MSDEEEKDWQMRFNHNWKLEDGSLYPSRASMYLLDGINKAYKVDDSNRHLLTMLAGSSLFQGMYDAIAEMIDKGEMTEVEAVKKLNELGKTIGKEIATGREVK